MGKYNFSAQKWAEFEQRLKALEEANIKLKRENADLRSKAERDIMKDCDCEDAIKAVFGFDAEFGIVVYSPSKAKERFRTFYQTLLKHIIPKAYTSPDGRERIVYKPLGELNENEYKICVDTLASVIDTMNYGKKKIQDLKEDKE